MKSFQNQRNLKQRKEKIKSNRNYLGIGKLSPKSTFIKKLEEPEIAVKLTRPTVSQVSSFLTSRKVRKDFIKTLPIMIIKTLNKGLAREKTSNKTPDMMLMNPG